MNTHDLPTRLEDAPDWAEIQADLSTHSLSEVAERYGVAPAEIRAAQRRTGRGRVRRVARPERSLPPQAARKPIAKPAPEPVESWTPSETPVPEPIPRPYGRAEERARSKRARNKAAAAVKTGPAIPQTPANPAVPPPVASRPVTSPAPAPRPAAAAPAPRPAPAPPVRSIPVPAVGAPTVHWTAIDEAGRSWVVVAPTGAAAAGVLHAHGVASIMRLDRLDVLVR